MNSTRTIVEERAKNVAVMDVFSKLIQERIIFIDDVIDEELTNGVIAQMLYLDSLNQKQINIYINSPGGQVYQGLAIYDVAMKLKSPIRTVCIGMAASMGAILMLMGSTRSITKHGRIMLHQLSNGVWGKLSDIEIVFNESIKLEKELYLLIEEKTNITDAKTRFRDDVWFNAEEALEAGIVTEIL